MKNIAQLRVDDVVNIDQQRVTEIVNELGRHAAENLIQAALEQLALALQQVLSAAAQDDLAQVLYHVDRLSRLAWQVGLVTLAGVAVDVGRCVESRDSRGLRATLARLERIGARSLTEIWDP